MYSSTDYIFSMKTQGWMRFAPAVSLAVAQIAFCEAFLPYFLEKSQDIELDFNVFQGSLLFLCLLFASLSLATALYLMNRKVGSFRDAPNNVAHYIVGISQYFAPFGFLRLGIFSPAFDGELGKPLVLAISFFVLFLILYIWMVVYSNDHPEEFFQPIDRTRQIKSK